jgi:hypothetical protein
MSTVFGLVEVCYVVGTMKHEAASERLSPSGFGKIAMQQTPVRAQPSNLYIEE